MRKTQCAHKYSNNATKAREVVQVRIFRVAIKRVNMLVSMMGCK